MSGPEAASSQSGLSSQSELLDYLVILIDVFPLEIIKKFSSSRDHLQQSATRVVVLLVDLEVLGQLIDALG